MALTRTIVVDAQVILTSPQSRRIISTPRVGEALGDKFVERAVEIAASGTHTGEATTKFLYLEATEDVRLTLTNASGTIQIQTRYFTSFAAFTAVSITNLSSTTPVRIVLAYG